MEEKIQIDKFYFLQNKTTYHQDVLVRVIEEIDVDRVRIDFVYPNSIVKSWSDNDKIVHKNKLDQKDEQIDGNKFNIWLEDIILISVHNNYTEIQNNVSNGWLYHYMGRKNVFKFVKNYLDFIQPIHFHQYEEAIKCNKKEKLMCFRDLLKPNMHHPFENENQIWSICQTDSGLVIDSRNRYYLIYISVNGSGYDEYKKSLRKILGIINDSTTKTISVLIKFSLSDVEFGGKTVAFVHSIEKKSFFNTLIFDLLN